LLAFEGNIVTVALFGFLVLVVLLWVVVIAHHRKSRDADTRGGTG
jgi:preprotein translocase subunit SecG